MINYYAMLEVKENATIEEIKEAYKKKLRSIDENTKDVDGLYLIQKYKEAYSILSNPESKRIYDIELSTNREDYSLIPVGDNSKDKIYMTCINNEIIHNLKIRLDRNKSYKKVNAKCIYPIICNDYSFIFAEEYQAYDNIIEKIFSRPNPLYLRNLFTKQNLTFSHYKSYLPWEEGFKFRMISGVYGICYPCAKFVPVDLIDDKGKIYLSDLKVLTNYIQDFCLKNKEEVDDTFSKTKEWGS